MEEQKESIQEYVRKYMEENLEGFIKEFEEFREWKKNPPLPCFKKKRKLKPGDRGFIFKDGIMQRVVLTAEDFPELDLTAQD
ncbi:hypothetical protein [Chitinophaga silvisoli]|uniref:Uncharacterized protein n=1 Tax=Chitinophaga silvisoli TaxID=2291814 RepID=A0A3E1NX38_9BACT|nr:hypothetical protein [Chitinophaga silvisoli]RFM32480.1 hypothetical protein DXN04_22610 [Chitinophaga silvisoli]